MKLRTQLIFLSLLSLSLPWAGCQYIKTVGTALQQGQLSALNATAKAIATRLAAEPELLRQQPHEVLDGAPTLYAHTLRQPIIIDGYQDDWRNLNLPPQQFKSSQNPELKSQIYSAKHSDQLYLFIHTATDNIRYHNPTSGTLTSADHVRISSGTSPTTSRDYILTTSAPGSLAAHYQSLDQRTHREHSIKGVWHETPNGYTLEVQLPLAFSQYGFGVQIGKPNGTEVEYIGTHHSDESPATLTFQLKALTAALKIFQQPELHLEVANPQGWTLAEAGSLNPRSTLQSGYLPQEEHNKHSEPSWLTLELYRLALTQKPNHNTSDNASNNVSNNVSNNTPAQQKAHSINQAQAGTASLYWSQGSDGLIGRSSMPIVHDQTVLGVLIAEQNSEQLLKLTGGAFTRLIQYSFMTTLLVSLALLSYASWLSWRIRRLGLAAAAAVAEDGQLQSLPTRWPAMHARDEIGELSRAYHALLERLEGHTSYLKTLASKLSHELRTPLAVVRSSLDNLEHETLTPQAHTYLTRAREGSDRLSKLISSMSAASRVESSIQSAERETFNLSELLQQLIGAYRDLYPQTLHLDTPEHSCNFYGSPELLVQLLDKLSDNASDFCPANGNIYYRLEQRKGQLRLSVNNDGPILPQTIRGQLFDSLVSVRTQTSNTPHLGLGLHIVRLIAIYHGGKAYADNRADESGVEFSVELPNPPINR